VLTPEEKANSRKIMEQHINTRYSLQNFPRHHEQYIGYFLTDYVVEKARVPSE